MEDKFSEKHVERGEIFAVKAALMKAALRMQPDLSREEASHIAEVVLLEHKSQVREG